MNTTARNRKAWSRAVSEHNQQLDSTIDSTLTPRKPERACAGAKGDVPRVPLPVLAPARLLHGDTPPIGAWSGVRGVGLRAGEPSQDESECSTDKLNPIQPAVRDERTKLVQCWLPLKTVSEANAREHWAPKAKRTRKARQIARALCPTAALPCTVRLTRYSPGTLDDDNLRGALKAVRDGIADRLGVADNAPGLTFEYDQVRAKRGVYGVAVLITGEP